jgi:Helix-turn-helix domain
MADRASITQALMEARSIVDEVLPWELGPRNRSLADRAELRKAALPVVFSALLTEKPLVRRNVVVTPSAEAEDQEVVTAAEAAKMLGVQSTRSVIEWAVRGMLPGFQTPGGRWRFRVEDVEGFQGPRQVDAGRPKRGSVPIGDIVRMKQTEGMTWREISRETGMSCGALSGRYRKWKADQRVAGNAETPELARDNS